MHPLGSIDDPISRPLAQELKKDSQFQVALQHHLLDGQPSGPEVLAGSVPNGQTLGVISESALTEGGLRGLSLLARTPLVLVSHPPQPYQDFRDVIRAAQGRPGQILVGSPGPRSAGQLAIEEFSASQNVALTAIAYKSNGPLIADVVSGRIPLAVVTLSAALPHARAGRIRVIGISSKERDPRLPEAKPLSSQGLENYELHSWWGAFGSQKISDDMASQMTSRLISLAHRKEFVDSMNSRGIDVIAQDSRTLEHAIKADASRRSAMQKLSHSTKAE